MGSIEAENDAPFAKPARILALRRADACASCGVKLPVGARARWDPSTRTTTGLECCEIGEAPKAPGAFVPATRESFEPAPADLPTVAAVALTESPPPISDSTLDAGNAGESAQREYDRRKDKREAQVRGRHPRLGGLILALSDEPQSTKAWAKGAEGERRVAQNLDSLRSESIIVLHDRRIPRSKVNIDHLVIAATGIHVIDAKRYTGKVEMRPSGSLFRPGPNQLFVGGRNKTALVEAMKGQINVVQAAIADLLGTDIDGAESLIRPALCFVDAEWSLFAKPMMLDGVRISGPKSLTKQIAGPGALNPDRVLLLGTRIAERLPPA